MHGSVGVGSAPLTFNQSISLQYLYYAYAAFCLPDQVRGAARL